LRLVVFPRRGISALEERENTNGDSERLSGVRVKHHLSWHKFWSIADSTAALEKGSFSYMVEITKQKFKSHPT
jgi:hypothetical protein